MDRADTLEAMAYAVGMGFVAPQAFEQVWFEKLRSYSVGEVQAAIDRLSVTESFHAYNVNHIVADIQTQGAGSFGEVWAELTEAWPAHNGDSEAPALSSGAQALVRQLGGWMDFDRRYGRQDAFLMRDAENRFAENRQRQTERAVTGELGPMPERKELPPVVAALVGGIGASPESVPGPASTDRDPSGGANRTSITRTAAGSVETGESGHGFTLVSGGEA